MKKLILFIAILGAIGFYFYAANDAQPDSPQINNAIRLMEAK